MENSSLNETQPSGKMCSKGKPEREGKIHEQFAHSRLGRKIKNRRWSNQMHLINMEQSSQHGTKQYNLGQGGKCHIPVLGTQYLNSRSEVKLCQEKLVGGNIFNGVSWRQNLHLCLVSSINNICLLWLSYVKIKTMLWKIFLKFLANFLKISNCQNRNSLNISPLCPYSKCSLWFLNSPLM